MVLTTTPTAARRAPDRDPRRRRTVAVLLLAGAAVVLLSLASLAVGARSVPTATVLEALTRYDPDEHRPARGGHLAAAPHRPRPARRRGPRRWRARDAGRHPQPARRPRHPRRERRRRAVRRHRHLRASASATRSGYVWFAFVGAAVASVVVYTVGSLGREGATPVKLALAGAAVTALLRLDHHARCCWSTVETLRPVPLLAGRQPRRPRPRRSPRSVLPVPRRRRPARPRRSAAA